MYNMILIFLTMLRYKNSLLQLENVFLSFFEEDPQYVAKTLGVMQSKENIILMTAENLEHSKYDEFFKLIFYLN